MNEQTDRTASFTFLGLDDVMTAGGQRIEEGGGEQTASFNFRHLLTRINIKAYAANEEVAKAFSGIGRMHFTKPQGNAPFGCQVTINLADGTADTRTAFSNEVSQWLVWNWNPAGVDDPSYINFVLTNAVGASNAQLVEANETQTEAWAVKHPTIYITCAAGTSQNDWVTSANTFLWGTPWQSGGISNGQYGSYNRDSGTKSIYDPCPVGYRVPPQDTWNNVVKSNITWSNNGGYMREFNGAWFPEFLNRKSADGSFSTYSGSYWLSSSDNGMNHYSTNMTLNSSYNLFSSANITACGDAKSVRCVSE